MDSSSTGPPQGTDIGNASNNININIINNISRSCSSNSSSSSSSSSSSGASGAPSPCASGNVGSSITNAGYECPVPMELPQPSNKRCKVCGDIASYNFYGCVACDSCRTFFRRQALNRRSKQLRCTNWLAQLSGRSQAEPCKMTPKTRKSCAKCRLDACFKAGMKEDHVSNTQSTSANCIQQRTQGVEGALTFNAGIGERRVDDIIKIARSPDIDDPLFKDLQGVLKDRLRITLLKSTNYGVKSTELLVRESCRRCDQVSDILEVVVERIVNAFIDCSQMCKLPKILQNALIREVISRALILRSIFHYHQDLKVAKNRGDDIGLLRFELLPLEIKALYYSCLSNASGQEFIEKFFEMSHKIPSCLKEDVPIIVFVGIYWMFESFFKLVPITSNSSSSSSSSSRSCSSLSSSLSSSSVSDNFSRTQSLIRNKQEFISILTSGDTQDIVYSEWFTMGQFLHRYTSYLYGVEAYQKIISAAHDIEELAHQYEHLAISQGQEHYSNVQTSISLTVTNSICPS